MLKSIECLLVIVFLTGSAFHLKSYLTPVNNSEVKKGLKYYLEAPSISHLKYPRKLTAKDPRKGSRVEQFIIYK